MSYNNENQIRTGVWQKEAKSGLKYYGGGKISIPGAGDYWVSVFKNKNKTEGKHPDLNVTLQPVQNNFQPTSNQGGGWPHESPQGATEEEVPF